MCEIGNCADCPTQQDAEKQSDNNGPMQNDIAQLRMRLAEAGCFQPSPFAYGFRIAAIAAALGAGWTLAFLGQGVVAIGIGVALVAIASVQAGFVAHDAGDGAVTGNTRVSAFLRHGLMSFAGALSASYFDYLHRMHHISLSRGKRGLGRGEMPYNPYEPAWLKRVLSVHGLVFYAGVLLLRGVLFRLESLAFVAANFRKARADAWLLALHYAAWLVVPALLVGPLPALATYLLIALVAGPYVGLVLTLNHEGMSKVSDLAGAPMLDRVLATTRNLRPSRVANVMLGGINNHIEHHLFPRIPASRLPTARNLTQEFCAEKGYAYTEASLGEALRESVAFFAGESREQLAIAPLP